MSREKTPKLVIAFRTTSAAMAMEVACSEEQGRIIPIPREISAGCGYAWCAPVELESELLSLMERNGIEYETKKIIALY